MTSLLQDSTNSQTSTGADSRLLTLDQLAERLQFSADWIRLQVKIGTIPVIQFNSRAWRFHWLRFIHPATHTSKRPNGFTDQLSLDSSTQTSLSNGNYHHQKPSQFRRKREYLDTTIS